MAILRLNGAENGDVFAAAGRPWAERLTEALSTIPEEAPVVLLLHGMRYSWRRGGVCDPQRTLYATEGARAGTAWPKRLGFSEEDDDGVCIAFGWDAPGLISVASANASAARAAPALKQVLELTHGLGRRIDVFAHSLGCALLFQAMTNAPRGAVRRAVLLGPAVRRGAGRRIASMRPETEFLHVMARANDLFDEAYHRLLRDRGDAHDKPLGVAGAGGDLENWLDFQLDHEEAQAWLTTCKSRPTVLTRPICHRLFYEDDAAMALYRDVLRDAAPSCFSTLRRDGAPTEIARRWSRIGEVPRLGLAMLRKVSGACLRSRQERSADFEISGSKGDQVHSI